MPTRRLPGSGPDPPASRVATETPDAVSAVATVTAATSSNSSLDSADIPSLHYYVFFGIIGTVFLTGAVLFYRASQLRRRRLREAAERARARGEPGARPHDRADFWGLGGLAAYTSDGRDRFGLPYPYPYPSSDPGSKGADDLWLKVPELHEMRPIDEAGNRREVDWDMQPLAVFTSVPRTNIGKAGLAHQSAETVHPVSPRDMGPRPRPPPIHIPLTLAPLRRSLSSRRRSLSPPPVNGHQGRRPSAALASPTSNAAMPELSEDSLTTLKTGSTLYMAALIRMPQPDTGADEDSDTAWAPGMELCVWRGVVGHVDDYS